MNCFTSVFFIIFSLPNIFLNNVRTDDTDDFWYPPKHECDLGSRVECIPTVVRAPDFLAISDAVEIHEGFLTRNTTAVHEIITKRTRFQRELINKDYQKIYHKYDPPGGQFSILGKKSLSYALKTKIKGKLGKLLWALTVPLTHYYADELDRAMSPATVDQQSLLEILGTISGLGASMVTTWCLMIKNGNGIVERMKTKSGLTKEMRHLISQLAIGKRDQSQEINETLLENDLKDLIDGTQKWELNSGIIFSRIIARRNYAHLRYLFTEFRRQTWKTRSLEEKLNENDKIPEVYRNALKTLIKMIEDRAGFFAERLYKSLNRWFLYIDDRTLIRVITSRSEIDLGNIKKTFKEKYNISLADMIREQVHFASDYKRALLNLVGE